MSHVGRINWNKPLQERGIAAKEEMKYEEFKEKTRDIEKIPKGVRME